MHIIEAIAKLHKELKFDFNKTTITMKSEKINLADSRMMKLIKVFEEQDIAPLKEYVKKHKDNPELKDRVEDAENKIKKRIILAEAVKELVTTHFLFYRTIQKNVEWLEETCVIGNDGELSTFIKKLVIRATGKLVGAFL